MTTMKQFLLATLVCMGMGLSSGQARGLSLVVPAGSHPTFQVVECVIGDVPDSSNPFDPQALAVDLHATTPSGKKLVIPAFWTQGFSRQLEGDREVLSAQGQPGWRARYLPLEVGKHKLEVVARAQGKVLGRSSAKLTVTASQSHGLVRVDPGSRYFRFDDGTPLFLNGLCACWHGKRGTYDYDDWLAAYEKAGINYIRIWMWHEAFGIEWDRGDRVQYRMDNAWRLDRVLEEASRRGVYVMLCFDYHGIFEVKPDFWGGNNFWPRHPYNATNGGPCKTQNDFFTNRVARELYEKRLRYMVGRWAAFPNILAWEFFNEIDNEYAYLRHEDVVSWHRDLSQHLRSIDPYRHLISSSFTGGSERPDLFALENLDFSQYHSYNEKHPADMMTQKARVFRERYPKPFFVSEYGTDWKGWKPETDPHLRALHQAIWSGAFTGAAGTGMTWWWESIHSANLYRHWSALAKFLEGTTIASAAMKPVKASAEQGAVKVWAVATPREALVWVLNPAMNWPEGANLENPAPVTGAKVSVEALEPGRYTVEWWDTLEGRCVAESESDLRDGKILVSVPDFGIDLAARIRRK